MADSKSRRITRKKMQRVVPFASFFVAITYEGVWSVLLGQSPQNRY